MSVTTADLLVRWLECAGADLVFGIPGGAVLPLYDALGRSGSVRHVLARHEQGAGFMAIGHARVTGRAGLCLVSSGPGLTNVVTALADANADSIPLVCIAGQVPRHLIGTDAFQEVATVDLVRPVTKAAWFADSPQALARILPEAFRTAEGGRPGPVVIDLPKDVQATVADPSILDAFEAAMAAAERRATGPDTGAGTGANGTDLTPVWDRAAEWIDAAVRPVLYVGGGVVRAGATRAVRRLAERAGIPVAETLMALGTMPPAHPLRLGMLGMHGARATNATIDASDLLIAIGARFDDRATGDPARFAPDARVIHVDIDPREIGKIRAADLGVVADAGAAVAALLERVRPRARRAWRASVASRFAVGALAMPGREDAASPYGAILAVADALPEDAIVTTDVGQHQMWVAQAFPFRRADRWLTSGGLGTMGFGLPAAIGAAIAAPHAPIVCFTGDGSLMMNLAELATLAELGCNVKIVLLDNAGLGLVRQQQDLFYGRQYVASGYSRPSEAAAIARAFGLQVTDLADARDASASIAAALAAPGPGLVRVPVDRDFQVLPMVVPGGSNADALDHPSAVGVVAA